MLHQQGEFLAHYFDQLVAYAEVIREPFNTSSKCPETGSSKLLCFSIGSPRPIGNDKSASV